MKKQPIFLLGLAESLASNVRNFQLAGDYYSKCACDSCSTFNAQYLRLPETLTELEHVSTVSRGVARAIKVGGIHESFLAMLSDSLRICYYSLPPYFLIDFEEISSTILAKVGGTCLQTPRGHATDCFPVLPAVVSCVLSIFLNCRRRACLRSYTKLLHKIGYNTAFSE